ncbi:MAG: hypothetical protein SPI09_08870 [Candidatus Limivicinus sp.]|nr:hypothetical protein [Clostridiales bacterium]MDY6133455.1 hypothetical protein [Candidatus Limivicinus sp.]
MDRYEQDLDLTELNNDLSLDDILSEYQADAPFVPSPALQAEPEDDPDDGFFRIAGEAVGRIRRTSPRQQPVPDPEHFWDSPVVPVQEEPAPDAGQFWDLPDLTVQEEPALETEPSAPPAEKKSALPSEDEIRAYMASFARGDYSDMDAGQSAPYREPEIDPRFLTKADYAQGPDVMMYGDNETDISADEDYEPPKKAEYVSTYAPDQFDRDEEEAEEADPEPGFVGRFRKKRAEKKNKSKRKKASLSAGRAAPPEDEVYDESSFSQTPVSEQDPQTEEYTGRARSDDEEFAASFRDYGATPANYAEDSDYDTEREINEAAEFNSKEDFFPSSFKEYLFSIVTSLLYKLRGGASGSATVQEDDEDLGPEVTAKAASAYYGSFIKPMRLRLRLSLLLLVFMAWLSLGLPVTGLLKNYRVAGLFCLGLQLCIMLLCLDVVTNGVMSAFRRRPGAETLAVLSCLLTSIDAVLTGVTDFAGAHMPLCLISSLSLVGISMANLFSCRGLRKALRVPAIGLNAYAVSGETGLNKGQITLLKSLRSSKGFVRRAEEAAPDEELYRKISVPMMILALFFTLIIAIVKKNYTDLAFILSAVFCPAVPISALLCFALPFFTGSVRIFSSGAGIAGWSGLCDIGQSKNLIVTDRDLFPEGTVELESVRIFADAKPERIISYAGSMLTASGCGVASCFNDLMEKNGCSIRKIENFETLPGGGMKGIIDSSVILCGSSDLMQLMNVRVPFRLVDRTSVLLAVDGILYGIFNMKYTADPKVRKALVNLMRSNRHPIFALRDFNATPEMLRGCFDVATDGYDFPPYVERFKMSEAMPSEDSKVAAVVCREGLRPLTHMADTGRSMYVTIRLNMLLTVLCALLGMLIAFIRLVGVGSIGVGFLFWYMILWLIPVLILSFILKA